MSQESLFPEPKPRKKRKLPPVLTIRQPWLHAILFFGKDIENRSWSTAYRGPLLLHAALKAEWLDRFPSGAEVPMIDYDIGGILGMVDLVDCVPDTHARARQSVWSDLSGNGFCWVLSNPRVLLNPFPCRGALGLWKAPAGVRLRFK